jgi:hypothetical protein
MNNRKVNAEAERLHEVARIKIGQLLERDHSYSFAAATIGTKAADIRTCRGSFTISAKELEEVHSLPTPVNIEPVYYGGLIRALNCALGLKDREDGLR